MEEKKIKSHCHTILLGQTQSSKQIESLNFILKIYSL